MLGLNLRCQAGSACRRNFPAENVFNSKTENPGNPEGAFQGRGVFAELSGDDCLAGNADGFCQSGLAHAAVCFAQLPDAVGNRRGFGHGSGSPAEQENLKGIFRNLRQHQAEKDQVEQHVAIKIY